MDGDGDALREKVVDLVVVDDTVRVLDNVRVVDVLLDVVDDFVGELLSDGENDGVAVSEDVGEPVSVADLRQ